MTKGRIQRAPRNTGSSEREIDRTIAEMRKQYGDASVIEGGAVTQPDRVSTGIFIFDFLTLGGIPMSRASMVVGERHAGKSVFACLTAAGAQRAYPDKQVAYIDVEGTFDPVWAGKLGVNTDQLVLFQPETGESAADVTDALIGTKEVSMVIMDSVAALVPMKEIDSSAEDALVGVQARLVGGMVRKATASMIRERKRKHDVSLLFVNQFRCLSVDTLVWTERGLLDIKDVVVGDYVQGPTGVRQVRAVEHTGVREGYEIVCRTLPPIRMSSNHRHFVVGDDGTPKEVLGSQITKDDWMIVPLDPFVCAGESEVPPVAAAFLGAYFADGCVTCGKGRTDARVSFTEVGQERHSIVGTLMLRLFNFEGSYTSVACTVGAAGVRLVDLYGAGWKGRSKRVPAAIRRGSRETIREFLRYASFDTHSFVRNKFLWTFETARQAHEVAALLRGFGVRADCVDYGEGRKYLSISGSDAVRYRDTIGFAEQSKQALAAEFVETVDGARGRYDVVPDAVFCAVFHEARLRQVAGISSLPEYSALNAAWNGGLRASRERLLRFATAVAEKDADFCSWVAYLASNRFAEVESIEPIEVEMVDIEVDGGIFVAGGVMTHNSKIGGFAGFGEPRSIPGGRALEFCTSMQLIMKNKENTGKDGYGNDTMTVNEHSFTITKNKLNGGGRAGEFRLLRQDNPDLGLREGEVDDASTMIAYAKKFGAYGGGGSSWKLEFWDYDLKFRGLGEAVTYLYENREVYWALRNYLIASQANALGMPDYFVERFLP